MDDAGVRRWRLSRCACTRWQLLALGACSLLLFWAPLLAPLIQGWTFVAAGLALRREAASSLVAALALAASLAGFALFLATEYLWVA
jgi:hypothetical protein